MAEKVFDLEVMSVDVDGNIRTESGSITSGQGANEVTIDGAGLSGSGALVIDAGTKITLNSGDGFYLFTNLPTSDPTFAGRIWNDAGTLKVSAG